MGLAAVLVITPLMLSVVPLDQVLAPDVKSLAGRRVLICGASSGIGEELAYAYARKGAHVALVARRVNLLERVAAKALAAGAGSAQLIQADLSSQQGLEAAMSEVLRLDNFEGELDTLVLNHAIQRWGWYLPENDTEIMKDSIGKLGKVWDFEFVEASVRVNLVSYMSLSVLSMPALIRAARRNGKTSHIIATSSGAGKVAVPKAPVYAGVKHALHGFFDSLRLELEHKELPVTLTTAIVGQVETERLVSLFNKSEHSNQIKMPQAHPAQIAMDLLRGGEAGIEEVYTPLSQGLHVVAILRPVKIFRWLLDRIALIALGGRNLLW
eukprot:TRINITY_DN6499_c0_g1_i15.p1 TRINITY_DN6499_c0_g1~~TRINITY_DN6499_c0_g1_i15.p1  ORF type:complete len:325 (-),score=66.04 TRINITY_DN6499_c0_g1_i15:351-1325(-)